MAEAGTYWAHGDAYDKYMGRWSSAVADRFVAGLDARRAQRWVDVGCGTGALTAAIAGAWHPASIVGVDASDGFLESARSRVPEGRFVRGDAAALPLLDHAVDAAVSGLVLNFVREPDVAVAEMARVCATNGLIAAYVWDYAGGMPLMSTFWDAATALDPAAVALDQSAQFARWKPDFMHELFASCPGIAADSVSVISIEVEAVFADFDDYWSPFLGGQGPAPAYAMSLDEGARSQLRQRVHATLPVATDGTIALTLRAWAAQSRTRR